MWINVGSRSQSPKCVCDEKLEQRKICLNFSFHSTHLDSQQTAVAPLEGSCFQSTWDDSRNSDGARDKWACKWARSTAARLFIKTVLTLNLIEKKNSLKTRKFIDFRKNRKFLRLLWMNRRWSTSFDDLRYPPLLCARWKRLKFDFRRRNEPNLIYVLDHNKFPAVAWQNFAMKVFFGLSRISLTNIWGTS